MQKIGLGADAITSIMGMKAESCDGKKTKMPYILVRSSDYSEIPRILKGLREANIGVDTEWELIGGFIDAERMKSHKVLVHQKHEISGKTIKLLKKETVTKEDIGKIFYSNPSKEKGWIVTREEFWKLNPGDIGGWVEIGEFDLNI